MEEDSAGEDGVAAAAEPSPNRARGARIGSLSFPAAAVPRARLSSSFAAVIGLVGAGVDVGLLAAAILVRAALPLFGPSGNLI
jgi:hypothetical protein